MSDEELKKVMKRVSAEEPQFEVDLRVDDLVKVTDGPLKNFEAKVIEIDESRGRVKVLISMFGRETPATLDFLQVKKV